MYNYYNSLIQMWTPHAPIDLQAGTIRYSQDSESFEIFNSAKQWVVYEGINPCKQAFAYNYNGESYIDFPTGSVDHFLLAFPDTTWEKTLYATIRCLVTDFSKSNLYLVSQGYMVLYSDKFQKPHESERDLLKIKEKVKAIERLTSQSVIFFNSVFDDTQYCASKISRYRTEGHKHFRGGMRGRGSSGQDTLSFFNDRIYNNFHSFSSGNLTALESAILEYLGCLFNQATIDSVRARCYLSLISKLHNAAKHLLHYPGLKGLSNNWGVLFPIVNTLIEKYFTIQGENKHGGRYVDIGKITLISEEHKVIISDNIKIDCCSSIDIFAKKLDQTVQLTNEFLAEEKPEMSSIKHQIYEISSIKNKLEDSLMGVDEKLDIISQQMSVLSQLQAGLA